MVIGSFLLAVAALSAPPLLEKAYHQQPPHLSPLTILFTDEQDVSDVWGGLKFAATPLRPVGECEDPGFEVKCCVPRPDGSWEIYSYTGGYYIYG